VVGIKLFYRRVQFFENFTLCHLHNFDVILGNTFLDAYEVDIFYSKGRLKFRAKSGYKLVNLNAYFNFALAKMGVNLVALTSELELPSF
jgi:hypothetical protein